MRCLPPLPDFPVVVVDRLHFLAVDAYFYSLAYVILYFNVRLFLLAPLSNASLTGLGQLVLGTHSSLGREDHGGEEEP